MQRGLRVLTLHWAIEKSPILLSQYWKNEWLDGTIIISSYFGGSNNIFADCMYIRVSQIAGVFQKMIFESCTLYHIMPFVKIIGPVEKKVTICWF